MSGRTSLMQRLARRVQMIGWTSSRRPTPHESRLLCALLSGDDPRLRKMSEQWRRASSVTREFLDEGQSQFALRWIRTLGCLTHAALKHDVESRRLTLIDQANGRTLAFRLQITAGGNCGPLIGEALDGGPFPIRWRSSNVLLPDQEMEQVLLLPRMADQEAALSRLSSWLGAVSLCPDARPFIELFDPAVGSDLQEVELRFGRPIPTALAQLFRVSNGLLIGETFVRPVQELVTTQQLKSYGAPPQLGCSLFLAEDVINGLSDGYYCMPVDVDNAGAVVKVDMYGAVDEVAVTLQQFVRSRLSELPLCELVGLQDGR